MKNRPNVNTKRTRKTEINIAIMNGNIPPNAFKTKVNGKCTYIAKIGGKTYIYPIKDKNNITKKKNG